MYIFREATERDFEGICNLFGSEEDLFLVYPGGKYPLTPLQVKELSQTRMELTVVADGNEIVGFANLYNYEPGKFAYVGNLVIRKDHRGKGLERGSYPQRHA